MKSDDLRRFLKAPVQKLVRVWGTRQKRDACISPKMAKSAGTVEIDEAKNINPN